MHFIHLHKLKKLIPTNSYPFFASIDTEDLCGLPIKPQIILIYYWKHVTYLSLDFQSKKSQLIPIPRSSIINDSIFIYLDFHRIWMVDLYHYLKLLLNGEFENTYHFHPSNVECLYFDHEKKLTQYKNLFHEFITYIQFLNPYDHTITLYHRGLNKIHEMENKPNPSLKILNYEKNIFIANNIRSFLYCEKLLMNQPFPSPNIFELKKDHRYEYQMNELLKDTKNIQSYHYQQWLPIFAEWEIYLKSLYKMNNVKKYEPKKALELGNQLFLQIIQ